MDSRRPIGIALLGPAESGKTLLMARLEEGCGDARTWATFNLRGYDNGLRALDSSRRTPTIGLLYGPQLNLMLTTPSETHHAVNLFEFGSATHPEVITTQLERAKWDAIGLCFDVDAADSRDACARIWWPLARAAVMESQKTRNERPFVFLVATSKGTRKHHVHLNAHRRCDLDGKMNHGLRFDIDLLTATPDEMKGVVQTLIAQSLVQRRAATTVPDDY